MYGLKIEILVNPCPTEKPCFRALFHLKAWQPPICWFFEESARKFAGVFAYARTKVLGVFIFQLVVLLRLTRTKNVCVSPVWIMRNNGILLLARSHPKAQER